jgi:hypothetical protein
MKLKNNFLVGDPVRIDSYTSEWLTLHLHPSVFYRRLEIFQESLEQSKGMYAEIDMGEFICIRFSEKEDLTNFYRIHHNYI